MVLDKAIVKLPIFPVSSRVCGGDESDESDEHWCGCPGAGSIEITRCRGLPGAELATSPPLTGESELKKLVLGVHSVSALSGEQRELGVGGRGQIYYL